MANGDFSGLLGGLMTNLEPTEEERQRAFRQGLLAAGLGILGANRPGVGASGAIGQGGLQGLGVYQNTLERARQAQQGARTQGFQAVQVLRQMQEDQLKRDKEKRIADTLSGLTPQPVMTGMADTGPRFQNQGPTLEQLQSAAMRIAQDNPQLAQFLMGQAKTTSGVVGGEEVTRDALGRAISRSPVAPATPFEAQGLTPQAFREWKERTKVPLVQMGLGAPIQVQTPDGQTVLVQPPTKPGGPAEIVTVPGLGAVSPAAKSTDTAKRAAGFATRMIAAESIIEREAAAGFPTVTTQMAGAVPLVGRYAQSRVMGPEQQKFRQAQEDWVRAKLRHESGAVIGANEMAGEISTYFPQPGDEPAVIAQKAQARQIATQGMLKAGGGAALQGASGAAAPKSGWSIVR